MSVLKRVRDMTVATLNDLLEKVEDPVQLIDQYIADRKRKIDEATALVHDCISHQKTVQRQYLHALEMIEKRGEQAALALKAGEEDLARLALQEKIIYEEKSIPYKEMLAQSERTLEAAEAQLLTWKNELQEVKAQREFYTIRLQSIRLQEQFQNKISDNFLSSNRITRRFEDWLNDLEWSIQGKPGNNSEWDLFDSKSTTQAADASETEELEKELNRLKQKLKEKEV